MTKDKLTLSDLATLLSEKLELSQKISEDFVKLFFETVEENLLANELVKIKNLGSFKLSWNEARKSVDVNTGDEIVIDGYHKVVFSPDASLKEMVNQPFAHLEPVVISQNENSVSEIKPLVDADVNVPLKALNDQADEIKNILSEINSMNEELIAESAESEDSTSETEAEVQPDHVKSAVSVAEEVNLGEVKNNKIEKGNTGNTSKTNSGKTTWIWGIAIVVLLVLGYYFRNSFLPTAPPAPVLVRDLPEQIVADSILPDSLDSVSVPIPADSLQLWFNSDRNYTEFSGSVKMSSGNRLTLIALEKYGAKEFWIYIYEANKAAIPNPDQISIGQTIQLPKLPAYVIDLQNPKCIEFAKHLSDELKSKGS